MKTRFCRESLTISAHALLMSSVIGLAGAAHADGWDDDGYRGYGNAYGHSRGAHITPYPPQMAADTLTGWGTTSVFTIGESIDDYTPPGIPDGMYAWKRGSDVKVLVNHELTAEAGYPYALKNGAQIAGARVSFFDIDRATRRVTDSGMAFDTIYNRAGEIVDDAADLEFGGLNRLCSANGIERGNFGFVDDIFFTGEETDGGTEFALDVATGTLWAAPAMGRAAWESVAVVEPPSRRHVAVIVGDDRQAAPLLLYVGEKERGRGRRGGNFLARNGLAEGKVYVWVSDAGDIDPTSFNGTGAMRTGRFVEIDVYNPAMAGQPGYDALGYADQDTQDALAAAAGAFQFSRPEDVHANPANPLQVAFASTGRSQFAGGVDSWGTTYQVDISYDWVSGELVPSAAVKVLYDGDDAGAGQFPGGPDFGLRSPDNLTWASDGMIYVQEDRSVGGFGQTSGAEASIWQLDPVSGNLLRIAEMDRAAASPVGVTDPSPGDIGNWESSGIIDVTHLFPTEPGELLLLANTQAHSLRNGVIASKDLVQGGQLFFLNNWLSIEE